MTTEPDTERLLLLAQIALEGAVLSDTVQAAATDIILRGILEVTRRRSAQGLPPLQYSTTSKGPTKYVYAMFGALPVRLTHTPHPGIIQAV